MPDDRASEEGLGPVERGRLRYQRKDYNGALEAFTEAVTTSTGHLRLMALDHRAATYEKLDQLKAALKDSKAMLDLKPELAKGYLRCAKVLQLKGEQKLALQIYERGLRKVKIGADNDRVTLQSMYTKLQQAQEPTKCLDPLVYFPIELIDFILEYMPTRELVVCLGVSRSWKRILESRPALWTTFDTTSARRNVTQQALKAFLRRSKYGVDHATISHKANFDMTRLMYLAKTCKSLRNLHLLGSGPLGSSLLEALPLTKCLRVIHIGEKHQMTFAAVSSVLHNICETIVEATFLSVGASRNQDGASWPSLDYLRSFTLNDAGLAGRSNTIDLAAFCKKAPEIAKIQLHRFNITTPGELDLSESKQLYHLDLRGTLFIFPKLPPTIKCLRLCEARLFDMDPPVVHLPRLEEFNCDNTVLDASQIRTVIQPSIRNGNLQRLYIGSRPLPINIIPETDFERAESVKMLSLANLQMSEHLLLRTVGNFPNLEELDVSETKITGVAIKRFLLSGIKMLKANECSELSSDAVEYARSKGMQVEFRFPSRRVGARSYRDAVQKQY